MRASAWRLIVVVVCDLLLGCALCAAQDPGRTPRDAGGRADAAADPAKPRIEESRPALYYLKDKNGNLQPVPGFSLEEFEELYKLKNQLAQREERPRYSLQRMSIQAQANGEQAELTVQLALQIRDESWVRVPLRFDLALLREPPQYKGPGEHFLHYEADGEGYVGWFRGQSDQPHELTLKFLVPLSTAGDETRLKFTAPRATSSELKLHVATPNATAVVSERATLQQSVPTNSGTDFTVLGLGGEFEIAWTRNDAGRAAPPSLETSASVLARIDAAGVQTEATLVVRSHNAPFDVLRVSLPPGAELAPATATGYTVAPLPGANPARPMVEVRLAKKTSGPVEIRLNAKRPPMAAAAENWTELAGFDVVGAARQTGVIAVAAMPESQVLWGPNRRVRQTDQFPEALRREDVAAAFEFFAQPFSLTARLSPKKTRIHVEPEYRLSVESDQVRLDARLRYTIRGVKVYALRVAMPGWELDDVGPEQLIAVDGAGLGENGVLSAPLLQATSGACELRIRAHRAMPKKAGRIEIALPEPQADTFGPAVLAVSPADNVELTPASPSMKGLVRESVPPQWKMPERQQPPLFYRGDGPKTVFAADFRIHTRQIRCSVSSTVDFAKPGGEVDQAILWNISYEPADALTLLVPRPLAHSDTLQILYQGRPLAATAAGESDDASQDAPIRMQVGLPGPCIGACELSIRYPLGIPSEVFTGAEAIAVPLLMPGEGEVTSNKLAVLTAPDAAVTLGHGPWTADERTAAGDAQAARLELTTAERPARVEVTLHRKAARDKGAVVAERAWLQTWLTRSARQDRAVFRFTSDRKEIEVSLPAGAILSQGAVSLDGVRLGVSPDRSNRISIPLADDAAARQYVLEMQYQFPNERSPVGALSIDLPRLGPNAWVRRAYWQLILPPNEHLVLPPAGLVSEFAWGWRGYGFGRSPLLEQADLESWSGASRRQGPPAGVNRYLFSAVGPVENCTVYTAERATIVFVASAVALALGLLLLYVRAMRHPIALTAGGAILIGLAAAEPAAAVLFLQAAALGVALAILGALLRRWTTRPEAGEPLSRAIKPLDGSRRTDAAVIRPPDVSTQTAPAAAAQPDPNA